MKSHDSLLTDELRLSEQLRVYGHKYVMEKLLFNPAKKCEITDPAVKLCAKNKQITRYGVKAVARKLTTITHCFQSIQPFSAQACGMILSCNL